MKFQLSFLLLQLNIIAYIENWNNVGVEIFKVLIAVDAGVNFCS